MNTLLKGSKYGFIVFLFLFHADVYAQYSAKASLDTSIILIGKQVTLNLELKKPLSGSVQWPVIPDSLGSVEVVSKGSIDTLSSDAGSVTLHQAIRVTAFDSGFFVIPPVHFYSGNQTDTTILASSNPVLLTVQIMPVDTTKAIKDIRDVREVPFDWHDYLYYIIGAIILIHLILLGIYIYLRVVKRKKFPSLFNKVPVIPPHETALAALKELDAGKHWQNGQYKYYHAAISDIIRTYIEARWKVPAMEQTTDEILNSTLIHMIDEPVKQNLVYILRIADLAKFAKLQPLAHENEQSMRNATEFITATIPIEVTVNKEAEA
ncbi:MAG: hypothetical protein ABI772_04810 [Bacteroidota bacterium]